MLDAMVAAAFEHIGEANQIAVDIGMGVFDRIAHPGLRGQMHDAVELVHCKQRGHAGTVGHVELDEIKAGLGRQTRQPVMLERRVVIVVQIIQADHLIAACQQQLADMHADEAGRAGDEYFHAISCRNPFQLQTVLSQGPRLPSPRLGVARAHFAP